MPIAWLNGCLIEGSIPFDPFDRGVTLGDGLFETIAIFNGKPAYLVPHLDRLENSTKLLGIEVSRPAIENGVSEVIDSYRGQNAILRITITRGAGVRALSGSAPEPTRLITIAPREKGTLTSPVRLAIPLCLSQDHRDVSPVVAFSSRSPEAPPK